MQVGIMKTDGGPHPPDKWARASAWAIVNHLIQIDENAVSQEAVEVRAARDELEGKLRGILLAHHTMVQTAERSKLEADGVKRLSTPFLRSVEARNVTVGGVVDVDEIVNEIVGAAKIHPTLFAHFDQAHVREVVAERLRMDFASSIDIERRHIADGKRVVNGRAVERAGFDANDPHVRAFKSRRAPGPNPTIDTAPKPTLAS
jgi:hypothetical protein